VPALARGRPWQFVRERAIVAGEAAMSEASELLATLRDVGEPPPPEGVPPALVLANVVLLALVLGVAVWRRRRRRRAWLEAALARILHARGRPPEVARLELAQVLRRVMRHRQGPHVDALQGDAWLARLDATFGGDWFTRGEGRAFGDSLYAPSSATPADVDALGRTLARRLRSLPANDFDDARAAGGSSADTRPAPTAPVRR